MISRIPQGCGLLMTLLLSACVMQNNFAPVDAANLVDRDVQLAPGQVTFYRVRPGDTLYSIAWRYDLDYRQLAATNHISSPYALTTGQSLRIEDKPLQYLSSVATTSTRSAAPAKKFWTPGRKPQPSLSNTSSRQGNTSIQQWLWPVKGAILQRFAPQQSFKGVDIAAPNGTKVRAAAAGTVAYAGSGLRAYGNLVIIKHNDRFLSAYAYNRELLVKEGDFINAGQVIAVVGHKQHQSSRLHFEIRVEGKPVDPLQYLT